MFEGKELMIPTADTHGIYLAGDEETLEEAVDDNLISKDRIEEFFE